jgi:hypothetical protein
MNNGPTEMDKPSQELSGIYRRGFRGSNPPKFIVGTAHVAHFVNLPRKLT